MDEIEGMNPKSPLSRISHHDQFQLEVVVEEFDSGFVIFNKVPIEKHEKSDIYVS
jgi:hypothetical protein